MEQIKAKSGSFGADRVRNFNHQIKSVVNDAFPTIAKYLFWCSLTGKGLFAGPSQRDEDVGMDQSDLGQSLASVQAQPGEVKLRKRRPTRYTIDKIKGETET